MAQSNRRDKDVVNAEIFKCGHGSNDIDKCVVPANFMEVNVLESSAMDSGFNSCKMLKGTLTP